MGENLQYMLWSELDEAEDNAHLGINNISPGHSIVSENMHSFETDSGKRFPSSSGALRSISLIDRKDEVVSARKYSGSREGCEVTCCSTCGQTSDTGTAMHWGGTDARTCIPQLERGGCDTGRGGAETLWSKGRAKHSL